ncbi:sugar phosphate isomerase/epimerase family protein [Gillisia sp. JM1]|uniref:sugar phosphate isomerase/epimerase family protein n=1 Tax=Gillisia sp. JM1 TaxID=1283286 RepID=UPI0004159F7A|nr:sugar phosphate isomerase/epimerase family protein [Gillisia sp. JM1]
MTRKSRKIAPLFLLALFFMASLVSCKNNQEAKEIIETNLSQTENQELFFKISLAQWSLSKPIIEGEMDPMNFAQKAHEMGFSGIEYVSGLYASKVEEMGLQTVLDTLKARSEQYNVENVLIMIDGEGDLAVSDKAERNKAVENHKKWVDAAQFLDSHSIRVNLFGSNDAGIWKSNSIDGLKKLGEYASTKGINVLVENHGYLSSNAKLLVEVMEGVNLPNVGTLPDFGNFCLKREGGERWDAKCTEEYPRYQGIEEMMPFAKAVSAKSYNFNEEGQETSMDFQKILKIVKDAGYKGYIGVEYEGQVLTAEEGIIATKKLLIAEGSKL